MRRYQTAFNREALNFAVQVDNAVFGEIELWVNLIERAPATRGDYTEEDDDGRELQVVVLRTVAITYWTDDAAGEVGVVGIESL